MSAAVSSVTIHPIHLALVFHDRSLQGLQKALSASAFHLSPTAVLCFSSAFFWKIRVTKHPSTLLQDCISPPNVHQRQLWLRGWGCVGGNSIEGLGKLYFPLSMGNWSGSICVLQTCASLQPLGNLVSHNQASSAACSLFSL